MPKNFTAKWWRPVRRRGWLASAIEGPARRFQKGRSWRPTTRRLRSWPHPWDGPFCSRPAVGIWLRTSRPPETPALPCMPGCFACGLPGKRVEFARGPFSVQATRELLQRWKIGVLVAKDGGAVSGLSERLEAARLENARVVVVTRPPDPGDAAETFEELRRLVRTAIAAA